MHGNPMASTLKILLLGDIVGHPGCAILQKHLNSLKNKFSINFVIVNGENSSQGKGITSRLCHFFRSVGVDVITTGNHVWDNREIYPFLTEYDYLLRPDNFPTECPGKGVGVYSCGAYTIGVLNVQGRVFMRELINCPFKAAESALTYLKARTPIVIVDMHAEATSEKMGLAYYLDGRVSAVVGTHTHVLTADERILPGGTAYITDLGMAGAQNSMLGMKKESIIRKMMTQMPAKFEVETQLPFFMTGVWIEVDTHSGKAVHIERIQIVDHEVQLES